MLDTLYNFDLPSELIAQSPANPRDSAKLLVYELSTGNITDAVFSEVDNYLAKDSTVVVNNSKVENCRLLFDEGQIELFIIDKINKNIVEALVRPGRKFKVGETTQINTWLSVKTLEINKQTGARRLELSVSHDDPKLKEFEHIPLPPYIKQDDSLAKEYQTVYAGPAGSLAAPTAGLHFTPELIKLVKGHHSFAEITLHVSLGTFAKLTEVNIAENKLHSEVYEIASSTAQLLNSSSHITAVGTTSIRTLESNIQTNSSFTSGSNSTDIFIRPGYKFKAVDSVITNFHLPSTSLLMLVSAFIADKKNLKATDAASELMRIYCHAIDNRYRFFSFGDAMLIV